ncbi:MAG TPA: hypothetical protein VF551_09565 [Chthoniobacterales bacterium]
MRETSYLFFDEDFFPPDFFEPDFFEPDFDLLLLELDLLPGSFSRASNVAPPQFLHFGIFLPFVT